MTSTLPPLTAVRRRLGLEPAVDPPQYSPESPRSLPADTSELPLSIPDFSRPHRDSTEADETFRLADSLVPTLQLDSVAHSQPTSAYQPAPIGVSEPHANGRLRQALRSPRQLSKISAWAATVVFVLALVISAVIGMVNDRSAAVATAPNVADETSGSDTAAANTGAGTASDQTDLPQSGQLGSSPANAGEAELYVHVLGQVSAPGLVRLTPGSRVVDAIDKAGGLLDTAELTSINLARLLGDGEQLYVLAIGEAPPAGLATGPSAAAGSAPGQAQLINLNTATLEVLDTLPRVGPALAQRIIDWREQEGPFTSVDDLLNVSGIGEKTLDGFRTQITV